MKTTNNLKYEELASVWKVFLFLYMELVFQPKIFF